MPDMKTLTINGVKYNIKDDTARTALSMKAGVAEENTFSGTNIFTQGPFLPITTNISWFNGATSNIIGFINETQYTGNATSATKATQDGNGDEISKTYAKLSAANKWSAQQSFKQVLLGDERYLSPVVSATSSTPQLSVMHYRTTGAFTLDLSHLSTILEVKASTVFTAFIESSGDYTLTITHAGIIKYMGSASDVALTSAGLLLNILMMKDAEGNVTSIVQASKLEGGA